jgi:hypothetical protein
MALLEKHLYTRKSQLPKAGKGLFTNIEIPKGTRIVEYKGSIHTWKEVKDQDGYNGYLMRASTGKPSSMLSPTKKHWPATQMMQVGSLK